MKESKAVRKAAMTMNDTDAINDRIEAFIRKIDEIK
jgi:hypothetical protein